MSYQVKFDIDFAVFDVLCLLELVIYTWNFFQRKYGDFVGKFSLEYLRPNITITSYKYWRGISRRWWRGWQRPWTAATSPCGITSAPSHSTPHWVWISIKNAIHIWICIKYCRTWRHLNPRLVNYRTSGYQFYHGAIAEDTRYKSNEFEHFESSQKVIEVTKYGKCIEDLFIKLIVNIKLY